MTPVPFEKFYDLSALSQAGDEIVVTLNEAERAALARFAEIEKVKSFAASVVMRRLSSNRFLLEFSLDADIVQSCVVTLEPVDAKIACRFERELSLAHSRQRRNAPESFEASTGQDDGPEEIESPNFDLAGPLLEEFILALEPYPRAPGAAFDLPADKVPPPDNPFAILKNLKKQGE